MAKQTYWMTDGFGVKALMEGADERDLWAVSEGWAVTTEPESGDMVWLKHEETGGQQKLNADVMGRFAALGWHPSPPPAPVDLTKDPLPEPEPVPVVETEQAVEVEQSDVAAAAADSKKTKSRAASGTTEEQ